MYAAAPLIACSRLLPCGGRLVLDEVHFAAVVATVAMGRAHPPISDLMERYEVGRLRFSLPILWRCSGGAHTFVDPPVVVRGRYLPRCGECREIVWPEPTRAKNRRYHPACARAANRARSRDYETEPAELVFVPYADFPVAVRVQFPEIFLSLNSARSAI